MIDPLDQEDRALVNLARGGCEPTEADRRRVRTALVARLGAGTGLVVTTALGTSVASSAAAVPVAATVATTIATTVATSVATKVMVAVVVVAAAVGGGGIAYRAERGERAVRVKAAAAPTTRAAASGNRGIAVNPFTAIEVPAAGEPPSAAPTEPSDMVPTNARKTAGAIRPARVLVSAGRDEGVAAPVAAAPSEPEVAASLQPPVFVPPLVVGVPSVASVPSARVPALPSSAFPPAAVTPTTIEAETRLLRAGIAALRAGDAAGALMLLDRHARVHPGGVLAEERDTERIAALCVLGRTAEARAAVSSFLRAHPRSHLAPRARAVCGAPSIP